MVKWNKEVLNSLAGRMYSMYESGGVAFMRRSHLPQRDEIIGVLEAIQEVIYPGYSGKYSYGETSGFFITGDLLNQIYTNLNELIRRALIYKYEEGNSCRDDSVIREESSEITYNLMQKLPEIREMMQDDCQAFLEGDPATKSTDEIILAYPGFKAIGVNRIAHELYCAKVPILPRVMSEYAHTVTGIDINPGATIGRHFFIDHGTGVVIGETAIIGDKVKIYQGVTLGALSFPKDGCGKLIKGTKRHPNIGNNVTIYAGATILGDITIGDNSIIGGNVWLTEAIPPNSKVIFAPSDTSIKIWHKS